MQLASINVFTKVIYSNVFAQVCKEVKVKEIKAKHGGINKREATTSGHCDLPEHNDEFPNIIFLYKDGADLEAIKKTVEAYTDNSAHVRSAIVLSRFNTIIFQMNRAAYLQVIFILLIFKHLRSYHFADVYITVHIEYIKFYI